MSVWLLTLHLLNFMAPACGVAVFLGLLEIFLQRKRPVALNLIRSVAIYFFSALAVLLLGLALLGRDAKMLTYASLVLTTGTLAAWRHSR